MKAKTQKAQAPTETQAMSQFPATKFSPVEDPVRNIPIIDKNKPISSILIAATVFFFSLFQKPERILFRRLLGVLFKHHKI